MPLYLVLPGISGNVATRGFENAIELYSIRQQARRFIRQESGLGVARDVGTVKLGHIEISKKQDASSSALYHYFCSANVIPSLDIYHCMLLNNTADWRYKLTLHNVMIAEHQELFSATGNIELLKLSYTQLEKRL